MSHKSDAHIKPYRAITREMKRVSEHLEESPVLLARPHPPKSWDTLRPEGIPTRGSKGGRGGDPGRE